jgi:hypothetical protein
MEARSDSLLRQYESGQITRRELLAFLTFVVASPAVASDEDEKGEFPSPCG